MDQTGTDSCNKSGNTSGRKTENLTCNHVCWKVMRFVVEFSSGGARKPLSCFFCSLSYFAHSILLPAISPAKVMSLVGTLFLASPHPPPSFFPFTPELAMPLELGLILAPSSSSSSGTNGLTIPPFSLAKRIPPFPSSSTLC